MYRPAFGILVFVCFLIGKSAILNAQWVQTNGLNGGPIVTCLAANGTALFAGAEGSGVYHSTNDGINWKDISTGLTGDALRIYALLLKGTNLFAGTNNGIFLSTDEGTNWSNASSGLAGYPSALFISSLVISDSNLFAGTFNGVYLSTNNGTSWARTSAGLKGDALIINTLTISGHNLFAGTEKGIYTSTDNGFSWNNASTALTGSVYALAMHDASLFAAVYDSGVYRSSNNGANWAAANTGLAGDALIINALTPSGANLFAGTNGGVYRSTDDGGSWVSVSGGLTGKGLTVRSFVIADSTLFAGTGDGVWKCSLTDIKASARPATAGLLTKIQLEQNYPNPVNLSTTINFSIPRSGWVSLRVYDVEGREEAVLLNKSLSAGGYSVRWDATSIPSGMYRYLLEADGTVQTRNLIVAK